MQDNQNFVKTNKPIHTPWESPKDKRPQPLKRRDSLPWQRIDKRKAYE